MGGWWFSGHGVWAQFAGAACHVIGGGCGGAVGGFEGGPRFDDAAGGACESACVTVDVPRMRQRSVKIGDLSVNPMRC